MGESATWKRVMGELELILEHQLPAVYDVFHNFRLGLQGTKGHTGQILKFGGCWGDMPTEIFEEFLEEIGRRRKRAFSRRQKGEACRSAC